MDRLPQKTVELITALRKEYRRRIESLDDSELAKIHFNPEHMSEEYVGDKVVDALESLSEVIIEELTEDELERRDTIREQEVTERLDQPTFKPDKRGYYG